MKRAWLSDLAISFLFWALLYGVCFAEPYAFVPDFENDAVYVIQVSDNEVVFGPIAVEDEPFGVAIAPDGRHVFVTNQNSNTVSVIDTSQLSTSVDNTPVVATIPVGNNPMGIAVSNDGKTVFVANRGDDSLSMISFDSENPTDAQSEENIKTTDLTPTAGFTRNKPIGLAMSSDGDVVYVANFGAPIVSVIDVQSGLEIAQISLVDDLSMDFPPTPYGITVAQDPVGKDIIYASCNQDKKYITAVSRYVVQNQITCAIDELKVAGDLTDVPDNFLDVADIKAKLISMADSEGYIEKQRTTKVKAVEAVIKELLKDLVTDTSISSEYKTVLGVLEEWINTDGISDDCEDQLDLERSKLFKKDTLPTKGVLVCFHASEYTATGNVTPQSVTRYEKELELEPRGLAVSENAVYVANLGSDSVSEISLLDGLPTDSDPAIIKQIGTRPFATATVSVSNSEVLYVNSRGDSIEDGSVSIVADGNKNGVTLYDVDISEGTGLGSFIGEIAPQRPTNLTATALPERKVELTWNTAWDDDDDAPENIEFVIQYKVVTDNNGLDLENDYMVYDYVSDLETNTYTVVGLDGSTTYSFRIAARIIAEKTSLDASEEDITQSSFSETSTVTTYPAAPTDLTVVDTSSFKIDLEWTDNTNGEAAFVVERKKITTDDTSTGDDDDTNISTTSDSYSVIANLSAGITTYSDNDEDLESNATYMYRVKAVDEDDPERESEYSNEVEAEASDKCFIATAAFGSLLEPHVVTLRKFRDTFLVTNAPGRAFVRFYYTYSPPVADYIADHTAIKTMVRWALIPMVAMSHCALHWGLAVTGMLLFTCMAIPVLLSHRFQRFAVGNR